MAKETKYENLFNDNGKCLTPEQMKLYVQNVLSPIEKRSVENHLLECEFCSDAIEGFKQVDFEEYQKEVAVLNQQIKRRVKYSSRKNIFYSPWKLIAVAASVLFLVLLSGVYFDWFLNTRLENVAKNLQKNVQDLSSKVSNLASLKKNEKKDTVTIIKEKNPENTYTSTVSATDDTSPLSETFEGENDSAKKSAQQPIAILEKENEENSSKTNNDAATKNDVTIAMNGETKNAMKMKSMASPSVALPTANYNIANNENSIVKKTIPAQNPDETEGLKQFNGKNYSKAIVALNNVVAKEPTNFQAKYYLGMSYLLAGKNIEAIKQFDVIMFNNNQDWYDDARYQKALAHLKIEDQTTAKNLFEQIVSEGGKYKTEAQQQLDELEK